MVRKASDATLLRQARADLRVARAELAKLSTDNLRLRVRADQAAKERDEWKERFDILLRRDNSILSQGTTP